MSFFNQMNAVRRKIMRSISGNIGKTDPDIIRPKIEHLSVQSVLINRPNHRLGNLLMISPLLQELSKNYPDCRIDLFVRGGLAPVLFSNYKNVDQIIILPKKPFKELLKYMRVWMKLRKKKYDLVINLDSHSSSGRIATKAARSKHKLFGNENMSLLVKYPDAKHMAKKPVYQLRENIALPVSDNNTPVPALNIMLSDEELKQGMKILKGFYDNGKPTISLFTFATGAKCYSKEWWHQFYTALSQQYSDYNFLEILPAENISQLDNKIPAFYSMDIREICSVIANTKLFIGSDSGMMHIGAAAGIPAIGLFSVTDMKLYEPYFNDSRGINTNETDTETSMQIIGTLLAKN